jgi:hypothetical protein
MTERDKLNEIQRRLMNSNHHLENVKFELRQSSDHQLLPAVELYDEVDAIIDKINKSQTNICTYFREILNK